MTLSHCKCRGSFQHLTGSQAAYVAKESAHVKFSLHVISCVSRLGRGQVSAESAVYDIVHLQVHRAQHITSAGHCRHPAHAALRGQSESLVGCSRPHVAFATQVKNRLCCTRQEVGNYEKSQRARCCVGLFLHGFDDNSHMVTCLPRYVITFRPLRWLMS
jgi:hypothetical protein